LNETLVLNICFVAERDPLETRERLIGAAAELFAERGFHGTTVRDIAARAGANVAGASYHFGSKAGLYLGALRQHFGEIRQRLDPEGIAGDPKALAALPRDEVCRLLENRIRAILEILLGPPPGLQGTLMMREMCDPSEALPTIVEEFIEPQVRDLGAVLRRLEPGLGDAAIERCVFSIMGQILYFRFSRPIQLQLMGRREFPRGFVQKTAAHITAFSLAGMERLAEEHGAGKAQRRRHAV
jgi:TetR/AcrR family transcriptional regulator, regulator of cefoperazone and chloramphenicol sensitivity